GGAEGLGDAAFVREHTRDFEALRGALAGIDVAEMGARCGIEPAAIVETAAGFARAESAAIFYDLGVEQTPFSTLISYLIRVLLSLTGNVGRRGGNVFFETLLPPVRQPRRTPEVERALPSGSPAIPARRQLRMFSPPLL